MVWEGIAVKREKEELLSIKERMQRELNRGKAGRGEAVGNGEARIGGTGRGQSRSEGRGS